MRRFLVIALRIVVGVYVGLCAMLFFFQRSMIYYPQPRELTEGVAVETLKVGTERLKVSTRPQPGDTAVIYFGGNAEDVSVDLPDFEDSFPDTAIYLLHYPGYGGSSGKPSEKSLLTSALALFDRVHAEHPKVTVIGRSLGTGVAVQVASQRPLARLVLVTPFAGMRDVASARYPFLPVSLLLRDRWESARYAPQVHVPTLILAAGDDQLIPRASTERLRDSFPPGQVHYHVIPNVGHNDISEAKEYWKMLKDG